ncbi:MAG: hypothetical protein Q7S51_08195 [Gallionellaceae bacterium]|nr:hypothetical protein [Gallionellaceae bacterium]
MANELSPENTLPSFAELQAAGAVIGEIRINVQDIFDPDDPKEHNFLFRLANTLHINTRPDVIRRTLLFKTGEPVSVRLIEETERLLRANRYLYEVSIRPTAYHNSIVDIEVSTRDTWTLDPGVGFSRSGGSNSTGLALKEYNLLGSGVFMSLSRSSTVDRSSRQLDISNQHAFGGWTDIDYSYAKNSDGRRQSLSVVKPFYALDTRWAAGASASQDNRVDTVYNSGILTGQYRHQQKTAEVFGGWSDGLIDNWTRRYSVGLSYQTDTYELDPALLAPAQLPPDQKLLSPFVRYEVVEDGYQKFKNRDQIQRPEYVAMGFQSRVQLNRALIGLGSTEDLWFYSSSVSNGYEILPDQTVLVSGALSGKHGGGRDEDQLLSAAVRYYHPQSERATFFASVAGDIAHNPQSTEELLLGGDNGLRGYPLRYQSGDKRVLLTVEQRVYSDWYPFRLFRVGGAAFYDRGRAWGGINPNVDNPGWLNDVGVGLRILSARSAFGNILHVDFAFPLNSDPKIKSFQFLVKSKVSF